MEQFRKIDHKKEVTQYRMIVLALLLVMSLTPMMAVFGILMPASESNDVWFQRSGSLVVLLASAAEYFSFKMYNVFNPEHLSNEPHFNLRLHYQLQAKRFMAVSAMFIAIGTIIWGYGDIIYRNL